MMEKRRGEEAIEKEHKEEKKLERARRAKTAMEENPDVLRKAKWPYCTQ